MSHELRTPLNSSLILAKLLADNRDGNLTDRAGASSRRAIYASGNDLLALINDILDLSKIEAGKVDVHAEAVDASSALAATAAATFEPVARQKALAFEIDVDADAPPTIETDAQRLQQILKNLLSNAFKFTERGERRAARRRRAGDQRRVRGARHRHRHPRATSRS